MNSVASCDAWHIHAPFFHGWAHLIYTFVLQVGSYSTIAADFTGIMIDVWSVSPNPPIMYELHWSGDSSLLIVVET